VKLTLSDTRLDGQNAWVAEITGTDPQYIFSRRFLRTDRKSRTITVTLEPGKVYEVCCPDQDERYFLELRKGSLTRISQASVREHFNWLEKERTIQRHAQAFASTSSHSGRGYDDLSDLLRNW
jgi:hypothetical protein